MPQDGQGIKWDGQVLALHSKPNRIAKLPCNTIGNRWRSIVVQWWETIKFLKRWVNQQFLGFRVKTSADSKGSRLKHSQILHAHGCLNILWWLAKMIEKDKSYSGLKLMTLNLLTSVDYCHTDKPCASSWRLLCCAIGGWHKTKLLWPHRPINGADGCAWWWFLY